MTKLAPRPAKRSTAIAILLTAIALPVFAAETTIDLSAEASRPAANDLIQASLTAEASGATPGELSRQINAQIADALKTAKPYQMVKVKSGSTNSYPVYSKAGKIESGLMRSELRLESADSAAMSELLGKLQTTLGISNLTLLPSPETRKAAENEAILDAIDAFKARAAVIAGAMSKAYHIKQLNVQTAGSYAPPMMRASAKMMSAEAVSMPMESGDSQISATVSGQIALD